MTGKITELTAAQWQDVYRLRGEWLAVGTCCDPADRPAAEVAVTEMYRLCGKPAPQFVWADSPATASLAIWLLSGKAGDSLRDSLGDSLLSSLRGSLGDSLSGSLGDSLSGSLGDSRWEALLGSLRSLLWDSLGDSLRNSLGSSLREPPLSLLRSLLWGSLWDSLRNSLRDLLWDSLRDLLGSSLREPLSWTRFFYGQHDAYWVAFYEVPRRLGIVTYKPQDNSQLDLWARLARSCGWWWPYENICVISERPSLVRTETWDAAHGTVRLHCADSPAMAFRDGWTVHAWHGYRVPADLIDPGWDTTRILAEPNAEVRRCAIERTGWDRFIAESGMRKVSECADPGNPGQVIALYDLPDGMDDMYDDDARILLCTNGTPEKDGTRRRFALPVPARHTDPVEAAADLYGWPAEAYRQLARRT